MNDRRGFYEERAKFRSRELRRFYHRLLEHYVQFLIPPGARILEIGCGLGHGVGVDFSPAMLAQARQRHPNLEFHLAEALDFSSSEPFDYILLSDLLNDLPDVQELFTRLRQHAHPGSRIVVNFFNNLWRPVLGLAESLGLKAPTLPQNWLSTGDVQNLFHLAGWEVIKIDSKVLCPLRIPVLAPLLNRWLAPLPILRHLCLSIFTVARPQTSPPQDRHYSCSVIIPARNESGNIEAAVQRVPELGKGTELIFIEGHSQDDTWQEIQRVAALYPERRIKTLRQQSRGKGGAVREAIASASGELLFILDADLTMPPEQLPKFYEVARSGKADFVNGVRLVYPMPRAAMRFGNMIANKLFGLAFTWLLGQPIKDTLCGTKVLFRSHYDAIASNRSYFGDFDPFGDFDLLFGAAKLNLRILDLPIRYQARTYGDTNIQRWRHGWLLLRMVLFAARRLKFI
jgi:SAM-dependent methyltransferase